MNSISTNPSRASLSSLMAVILIAFLLAVPIYLLAAAAAEDTWRGFSFMGGAVFAGYLRNSAASVFGAVLIAVLLAVPPALITHHYRFFLRDTMNFLAFLPLTLSASEVAGVLTEATSSALIEGRMGLAIVAGSTAAPWVFLLLRLALAELPRSLADAAATLGVGIWRRWLAVKLPLLAFSLGLACLVVAFQTLGEYGAAELMGVDTVSVGMYRQWFASHHSEAVTAMAVLCLALGSVLCFGLLIAPASPLKTQVSLPAERFVARSVDGARAAVFLLVGVFCALPGFLVPMGLILRNTIAKIERVRLENLYADCFGTVVTALFVVVVSLAFTLLLAWAAAFGRQTGTARASFFAAANLLLPPLVFAAAVLEIIARLGLSDSPFFAGEGPLVLVNALRFTPYLCLPVIYRMGRISPGYTEAARTLGVRPFQAFTRVGLALLRPALVAGALAVFILSAKELAATIFLQPFGYRSLALRVFQLAQKGMIREASVWILASVLVCLYPVWILARGIEQRQETRMEKRRAEN